MKQVIVVNTKLAMPTGKLAAQVAHASVAALFSADQASIQAWLNNGMPKIILRGKDDAELTKLHEQATAAKVPAHLIRDAGRTVLAPGTVTCLGIGPATPDAIDAITGELKLLR